MLWLKSTGRFKKQIRLHLQLNIKKIGSHRKRSSIKQFRRLKSKQIWGRRSEAHTNKENSKINQIVVKSFLEHNCKRFSKNAIQKKFILNLTQGRKKLRVTINTNIFTNTREKNTNVSNFLLLCLNDIWAPGTRLYSISEPSSFFWFSQAKNTFATPPEQPTTKSNINLQD